jgi:hypothetical protein
MEAKLKTDRRGEPGIARAGGQAAGASSIHRIDTRLASLTGNCFLHVHNGTTTLYRLDDMLNLL